jgi:hypothetical protein
MNALLRALFGRSSPRHAPTEPDPAPQAPPGNVSALQRYGDLCRAAGVDRLYLFLTFDCDTDGDIDVVHDLDRDLRRRGLRAGYAVPGVQLGKGADTWRQVADLGSEFLNHGGRAHTAWREDRYWPVTFYDQLSPAEVVADVTDGHRMVCEVIGTAPEGFRAPHFGSFQAADQLELLYRTLRPLGYRYCSTTLPSVGLARGPVIDMGGITELPTMGSYRNPTTLLDSWTYLTNRATYVLGDEYYELFAETVTRMTDEGIPGILTYYADPSHVIGQKPFERALDAVSKYAVPSLQGRDIVQRFRGL